MSEAVGIRFEPCGKVYCFKANGLGLRQGESVVVESEMGISIGRVVRESMDVEDTGRELKPILRRVTEEDMQKQKDNEALCREALEFCNERIMARGLSMKLLSTDVTLDRKRIVFFFFAETRIDFRELVKDLAAKFRTRIELRQVGVRDAARIAGGLGVCGRELCCRRFLTSFEPISIKMAKKQDLALNTSKLSGVCGRLMCCLGYEYGQEACPRKAERPAARPGPGEARPAAAPEASAPPPREEPKEEQKGGERRKGQRRRTSRSGRPERRKEEAPVKAAKEQAPEPRAEAAQAPEPQPAGKAEEAEHKPSKPFRKRRRRRRRGKPGK